MAGHPGHHLGTRPARRRRIHAAKGRGIRPILEDIPVACWLPVKYGLNPHGMRHGHKTWMAEDGIPEILAEHRLGHEVPGMRGLYAHISDRMREDLKAALQARWEDSVRERAALHEHSPVPLLDELLAPFRAPAPEQMTPRDTQPDGHTPGGREKMISQIPPNQAENPSPASRLGSQGKSV